jgi:hypothetical protein
MDKRGRGTIYILIHTKTLDSEIELLVYQSTRSQTHPKLPLYHV